jgi:hypothetical protein
VVKKENMEKIIPIAFAIIVVVGWFVLRSNEKLMNNLWLIS